MVMMKMTLILGMMMRVMLMEIVEMRMLII